MKYEITGEYTKNRATQKFSKEVAAGSEKLAREKIYSLLGGKQRLIRNNITLTEVKMVK